MTENMRIWDAVSKTDPKHTKKVTFGRTFTSIDAHWQIQQATAQFGPVGQGWGYTPVHSVERLSDQMVLAVADVTIWWRTAAGMAEIRHSYGPIRATCEMWAPDKNGKMRVDEDAPKKAMTDALTKGLSHLGFSADVFLGLFDDNRYVQKVEREFAAGVGGAATASIDEARREIAAQTGNDKSTYRIAADKKGASNAKAWADTAIETMNFASTREDVDGWFTDPGNAKYLARLGESYPDQYERITIAADNARDRVRAVAA